jgi:hypothetical protein
MNYLTKLQVTDLNEVPQRGGIQIFTGINHKIDDVVHFNID